MRIALAGNPNSGKTTMFNALTGANEHVGNWAGVTVDKKEQTVKKSYYCGEQKLTLIDLPGTYSMSPFTAEESVTRDYIENENPDVIINIVDATNLSRSLFFTTQLLELNIPLVIALNKSDVNKKKKTEINSVLLSKKLGCPVIDTVSTSNDGLSEVVKTAVASLGREQTAPYFDENILTDKKSAEASDRRRFIFVNRLVKEVEKRKILTSERNINDKIDSILTNKWLGIPIFAVVMFFVFYISQASLGPFLADFLVGWIDSFKEWVGASLEGANPLLYELLVNGIIGGVGAVVGFLPLVMVMYFLIALLEDCGYMARVSVVLDPIFKRVGLSGKSVIPFVIGTGCAIPGIMACRTIRNERERRATAMLTPFMPCGAKLPVIALFAGAFFKNASWVGTLMYFLGIILIFFCALLINKITGVKGKKSFFIMELPEYKIPAISRAFTSMCSRGWAYIVKAGTVILLCNTAVQLMQSLNLNFTYVEEGMEHTSILATVASPFAYLFAPIIGIVAWQFAAAAITGFIAKENVVATLAVCFSLTNFIDTEELALIDGASTVASTMDITSVAALAFLMFNLFSPPCFAAIGAMNSEMKSKKWFWGGIGLQMGVGYTLGFLVYFFGSLITGNSLGEWWMPILGFSVVAVIIAVTVTIGIMNNRKIKKEI